MIPWLAEGSNAPFPPLSRALREPNGLLCAGADLSVPRLKAAYRSAIFPWFNEGEPPLWWSPDPRMVLKPDAFHASRRLQRSARAWPWHYSINQRFPDVLRGCAAARSGIDGTWLHNWMFASYVDFHRAGYAHSIEIYLPSDFAQRKPGTSAWRDSGEFNLVGGTYGVAMGSVFFAESMFSAARDASKMALWALSRVLVEARCSVIDCQLQTPHLLGLGAREIPRSELLAWISDDPSAGPVINAQGLSELNLLLHCPS